MYNRPTVLKTLLQVSSMAKSRQSSVQDKIADVTECSICAEIFTNPKILPCVHTFCLHCLEKYGEGSKPGDQMVCPICRNEFIIPGGGLCNLPNNFMIGKMVEIGKLAMAPVNEATCNICPEGEEAVAKMLCVDCEQIFCERCSKSHKKTKSTKNHQVVELGSKLNAQSVNLRNSYCDHHPDELIKMYCYNDNEAICLICCAESHDTHKRIHIEKAAGEFKQRLKEDLTKVTNRLPEYEKVGKKLQELKDVYVVEMSKTEDGIRDTGRKMKELIDQHTELLVQRLKSVMEENLKAFEITRQDVERFKVMIESYARYSEELISRGSPVDICKAADQMHTRAVELEKLPVNCIGGRFCCKTVTFQPSNFENLLKQCRSNNAVGEITITESPDRIQRFEIESTDTTRELVPLPGFITVTTVEPDMLGLDDDLSHKRAKMPCGHVIAPESMMEYCRHVLKEGNYNFRCPDYKCTRIWEYFLVRHAACLSPDEMYEVEKKIADNYLRANGIKKCPGCHTWCFGAPDIRNKRVRCPICTKINAGTSFTFCWNCEKKWQGARSSDDCGHSGCESKDVRLKILATCPTKRTYDDVEFPVIRGCPDCGYLIENKEKSRHVICKNCKCRFCFVCLKKRNNEQMTCTFRFTCKVAPRQTFLPGGIGL